MPDATDRARRYIAGAIVTKAATLPAIERPAFADRVAIVLRELDEFGVETVAETHGWKPCCDGTGWVRDCGHDGAACPCRETMCTDCGGA